MIYRMVVLEVDGDGDGDGAELALDLRAMPEGKPTETLHLGGLVKRPDGWHVLGRNGAESSNAFHDATGAIQVHLEANARLIARRLAP